jgi:3-oxoacyl-[acyl-carrier-protein] synthase I
MYLAATGMVCPVGLNAAAACAAIRAGLANMNDLPYPDNRLEPVVGGVVPGLPLSLNRDTRLVDLLALALSDCLADGQAVPLETVPLLVGLTEPGRAGGAAGLVERLIALVQERLGARFHPSLSRAIAKGHTAGFEAFRVARSLLHGGDAPVCLVCGVDSYVNAGSLLWLDQHRRLKTPSHSDGVIPGEAAAAVLVQRTAPPARPAVGVVGIGFGMEEAHVLSEEPLLGLGLAQAARNALAEARLGMEQIDLRLADLTGESYGFKEHSLALSRTLRVRREQMPLKHLADTIGDVGAAAGVCQAVLAYHALRKWRVGTRIACYTSAVPGDRAMMIVQAAAV